MKRCSTQCNNAPWISVTVGILTLVSPWVFGGVPAAAAVIVTVVGLAIATTGIFELSSHGGEEAICRRWPIVHMVAGLVLIVSMALVPNKPAVMWNDFVLGTIALVTGLVSLSQALSPQPDDGEGQQLPSWRR